MTWCRLIAFVFISADINLFTMNPIAILIQKNVDIKALIGNPQSHGQWFDSGTMISLRISKLCLYPDSPWIGVIKSKIEKDRDVY